MMANLFNDCNCEWLTNLEILVVVAVTILTDKYATKLLQFIDKKFNNGSAKRAKNCADDFSSPSGTGKEGGE